MKKQTFERTLRAFNQRRAFKPFVVELVGGARLTIDHPEALVHRVRAAMYVDPDGNFAILIMKALTS
jgi:hypothetical protein